MDIARFQASFASDGDRMVEVVAGVSLTAPVPTCPGWTVRDLVEHTAQVYEHKIVAIELGGPRPDPWPPVWPEGRDPVAWLADSHARLLSTLRTTDPAAPSWTWVSSDPTVGFWSRRMAHEAAVHRVDAESAAGRVTPLDADLAEDGVAEVLDLMLAGDWSDEPQPGSEGTVVVGTGRRRWHVTMTPDRVDVREGDGDSVVVITAGASELDLWLWGRAAPEDVLVEGDPQVGANFRRRLALATQ